MLLDYSDRSLSPKGEQGKEFFRQPTLPCNCRLPEQQSGASIWLESQQSCLATVTLWAERMALFALPEMSQDIIILL